MPSDTELTELLTGAGKTPEQIMTILGQKMPPPLTDDQLRAVRFEVIGSDLVKVEEEAKSASDVVGPADG